MVGPKNGVFNIGKVVVKPEEKSELYTKSNGAPTIGITSPTEPLLMSIIDPGFLIEQRVPIDGSIDSYVTPQCNLPAKLTPLK